MNADPARRHASGPDGAHRTVFDDFTAMDDCPCPGLANRECKSGQVIHGLMTDRHAGQARRRAIAFADPEGVKTSQLSVALAKSGPAHSERLLPALVFGRQDQRPGEAL